MSSVKRRFRRVLNGDRVADNDTSINRDGFDWWRCDKSLESEQDDASSNTVVEAGAVGIRSIMLCSAIAGAWVVGAGGGSLDLDCGVVNIGKMRRRAIFRWSLLP